MAWPRAVSRFNALMVCPPRTARFPSRSKCLCRRSIRAQSKPLVFRTSRRVEEGDAATAERDLRAAEQALQEALARGAPDEEIDKLMDDLERALDRFLQAMADRMRQQMQQGSKMQPMNPNARMVRPEELKNLLDQAREMARSGARDAAKDLLAQLQEMLENLQAGMMAQAPEGSEQAMKMMNELNDLMRTQQ